MKLYVLSSVLSILPLPEPHYRENMDRISEKQGQNLEKKSKEKSFVHKSLEVGNILQDFFSQYSVDYKIVYDEAGRPSLSTKSISKTGGEAFYGDFNISHSGGVVAVFVAGGFSSSFRLGCDVECLRPRKNFLEIASEYFSFEEYEWIIQGEKKELLRFYTLWTAKEAWLKSRGQSVFDMRQAPSFCKDGTEEGLSLAEKKFMQFFLTSPEERDYVLTITAPFSLDEVRPQFPLGWRLKRMEAIYPVERPANTVSPKI